MVLHEFYIVLHTTSGQYLLQPNAYLHSRKKSRGLGVQARFSELMSSLSTSVRTNFALLSFYSVRLLTGFHICSVDQCISHQSIKSK
jgi:hypothetical protein